MQLKIDASICWELYHDDSRTEGRKKGKKNTAAFAFARDRLFIVHVTPLYPSPSLTVANVLIKH